MMWVSNDRNLSGFECRVTARSTSVAHARIAICNKEVIAKGSSVKIRKRLEKLYEYGSWRKMKGIAEVRLSDGSVV